MLVASALLVGCGGSDAGTTESLTTSTDPTVETAVDERAPSTLFEPEPLQFGPLADFEQGINELDVPRRVFLIVDGENISAFDRKDPNIGCMLFAVDEQMRAEFAIADRDAQFYDPCRGSAYDISGQPLCTGSRALQPIEIDVVDGIVTWAGMNINSSDAAVPVGADCPNTLEH